MSTITIHIAGGSGFGVVFINKGDSWVNRVADYTRPPLAALCLSQN